MWKFVNLLNVSIHSIVNVLTRYAVPSHVSGFANFAIVVDDGPQ